MEEFAGIDALPAEHFFEPLCEIMRAGRAERRGLSQSSLAHGGKIDGNSQRAKLFV